MIQKVQTWLRDTPWIWALIGVVLVWIFIGLFSHTGVNFDSLVTNASLACYLAIVGLGQMFPITTGQGGIDLSIPYVLTMSSFVSMGIIHGDNRNLVLGVAVTIAMGLFIGLINGLTILVLKVPPIIATMGMGFVVETAILLYQPSFSATSTSPLLSTLTNNKLIGVPSIAIVTIVFGIILGTVLTRTVYGRALLAVGQNRRAAYLSGIKVWKTVLMAYLFSSGMASVAGILLSAHVQGAYLQMGQPYLLESVGAVVLGGSLISGGKSNVTGTLLGALFLTLIVTLTEVTHLAIGGQDIVEGLVIIGVLSVAARSHNSKRRRHLFRKSGSGDLNKV